jgi:hypothetical protein
MKITKANGMFKLIAQSVCPQTTLVIDDRSDNIEKAKQEDLNLKTPT